MSNIQRDKFLTEAMGECWHVTKQRKDHQFEDCIKCGKGGLFVNNTNDFSTWEGFGKLYNWVMEQEWLSDWQDKSDSDFRDTDNLVATCCWCGCSPS